MRKVWMLALIVSLALPAMADEKGKGEGEKKPRKEKIAYVLTNTKGHITDTKPWVTLRLFRGMPFEYIGSSNKYHKPYYTVRFLNGETLWLKARDVALKMMVVKLPKLNTQKKIYQLMMSLDKRAELAAAKRGSGMKQESKAYFKTKFLREYYVQVVGKYKLTHGAWQKIKAKGDAEGWGAKKKK